MAEVPFRALPHDEEVEAERERIVRTLVCPVCGAPSRWGCAYEAGFVNGWMNRYSHTGRYDRAAQRGLVPAMAGTR